MSQRTEAPANNRVGPARMSSAHAKVVWPMAALLVVVAALRLVLVSHQDHDWIALPLTLVVVAVIAGAVGLFAEHCFHAARRIASSWGLPYVIPVVVPRRDLQSVGGWRGRLWSQNAPVSCYAATDGHSLRVQPVRLSKLRGGSQPCTVDLDAVTGDEPTMIQYGAARRIPAVALHLRDSSTLRLGCSHWDRYDVQHSPLARFVSLP